MKIYGLTGGIASGKSTVTRLLRAADVPVVDADQVARRVVEPGTPALAQIEARFGSEVIGPDGRLNRPALGAIVFHDKEARLALNAIVHPAVKLAMAQDVMDIAEQGHPFAFMDIPLLYEGRDPADFEAVVVVWVDGETQLARLMARDDLSEHDAKARVQSQMSLDDKAKHATWVIDNSEDPAFTEAQVEWLLGRLRQG